MIALLSRVFGSVIIGTCLSGFVIVLMTIFLGIRNLPAIVRTLQRMLRSILRGSYRLYSAVLSPVRIWIFRGTGLDIFHPVPRIVSSVILSLGIGFGVLTVFSMEFSNWILIALALHGLFVGLAWENILLSDDFQMGVNLE